MFEFGIPVNWMYCLELIKFDVSITSYYVAVRSWKMILGGHVVIENFRENVREP